MTLIVSPVAAKVEAAIMGRKTFEEKFSINAHENDGVVTLRGKVPSKKFLQLAESIALGIEGVSNVINQIEVDSSLEEDTGLFDLDDETQVPPSRSGPHARK